MAIEVDLDGDHVEAAPGEAQAWSVSVRNTAEDAGVDCRLAVRGAAADWMWVARPELALGPGETASVRMGVRLPAGPGAPAGRSPYRLEVTVGGAVVAAVDGSVEVAAAVEVAATLSPLDAGRHRYRLSVTNRGNVAATVSLAGRGGSATVEPASVSVPAGDTATATVVAGGRAGTGFEVEVRPEGGPASVVRGVVVQPAGVGRGRGPRWRVTAAVPVVAVAGVLALVAVAVAVAVAVVAVGRGTDSSPPATSVAAPTNPADCPLTGHLASEANGRDRPGVPTPVDYSFLEARPGGCEPVRFNPCEPIRYVINSALAPPGGVADLETAFALLAEATGMTFVNDGPTDEPASVNRVVFQPQRYGQRWAPILVVWARGEGLRLARDNPGGGRATQFDGVYVSGVLVLNVDAVTDGGAGRPLADGFGPGASWGRVMIHELGHMVGLGHVLSPAEVMFGELGVQSGRAEYHAGDRSGLRAVGAQRGCLTPPAIPPSPSPTR